MSPIDRPSATVYFDGTCPMCSREVAMYRRQSGAGAVQWVDEARCEAPALRAGLTRAAATARPHVHRADGSGYVAAWPCGDELADCMAASFERTETEFTVSAAVLNAPTQAKYPSTHRSLLRLAGSKERLVGWLHQFTVRPPRSPMRDQKSCIAFRSATTQPIHLIPESKPCTTSSTPPSRPEVSKPSPLR